MLSRSLKGPSCAHLFGFDPFGRDLLLSTLAACGKSSLFAGVVTLISVTVGCLLGAFLSLSRGSIQFLAKRVLEGFLAFPSLLFALALASLRGPGWGTLFISLLIGVLPSWIRLVSIQLEETLGEDYVLISQSMGASHMTVFRNHLIPTLRALIRVKAPLLFSHALMAEATLSFLGIGAPIGAETWGSLLAQGKDYLIEAPHIALASGLPLILTLLSLQKLAESW